MQRFCASSCSIFSGSELTYVHVNWYGLLFWQGVLKRHLSCSPITTALGQLTNHNTFSFSEGGPSSNPELIELFVPGWGERYCNNVNYVKNNAIFELPSVRACSSTPPKQNQDFLKEHNRTPLKSHLEPTVIKHTAFHRFLVVINIQVHLSKLECHEKVHFFL